MWERITIKVYESLWSLLVHLKNKHTFKKQRDNKYKGEDINNVNK